MHVERDLCMGAQGAHHRRTDRDVRHEVAVHNVDMNPIGARAGDSPDFLAEVGEISGK